MTPGVPKLREPVKQDYKLVVFLAALGIVKPKIADLSVIVSNRTLVECGAGFHDYLNPSDRASSSGISICILSIAVEKVLPCASVISESVPPPPRLSCRRKFSAPRFGNSNRSTSPLQIP